MLSDFPKVECPFVRKVYKVNPSDFKKFGSSLKLREPAVYLVEPEINEGFDWVLNDPNTFAVEKVDGSNLAIRMEGGRLMEVQNRMNVIDPLQIMKGNIYHIEGIFQAIEKDYLKPEGIQYGESLGPKLQANPYKLPHHLWYPFSKAKESLRYKSFEKHPKGYWEFSEWFRLHLKSLFYCRFHKIPISDMATNVEVPFAEGVVFYNGDKIAKLRRDMWYWHYCEKVEIYDLSEATLANAKQLGISVKGY